MGGGAEEGQDHAGVMEMTLRIAILDDYQNVAKSLAQWDSLPAGTIVQTFNEAIRGEDDLVNCLESFDVVVAMRERTAFPATVINRLSSLKLLASTGVRNAAIDVDACHKRGVAVCGARGARNGLAATAETAWALILALHKRLVISHIALGAGHWQPELAEAVEGKVLGIVGLGNIGKRMARIGQAFGMKVIAWSPNLTQERAELAGVQAVGKDVLFATADVVTLHLVLSPSTCSVVSGAELSIMKAGAFLVNTARAGLVEEPALVEALRLGNIGGAGLDVFWTEPLPRGHALCGLKNVVLTPHLGYATSENLEAFYGNVLGNIKAWLAGKPLTPLAGLNTADAS